MSPVRLEYAIFMLFMPTKVAGGFVKSLFFPANQVIFDDKYMFYSGSSQSTSAYVDGNAYIVHSKGKADLPKKQVVFVSNCKNIQLRLEWFSIVMVSSLSLQKTPQITHLEH